MAINSRKNKEEKSVKKIFTIIMPFVFTMAGIFGTVVDVNAEEQKEETVVEETIVEESEPQYDMEDEIDSYAVDQHNIVRLSSGFDYSTWDYKGEIIIPLDITTFGLYSNEKYYIDLYDENMNLLTSYYGVFPYDSKYHNIVRTHYINYKLDGKNKNGEYYKPGLYYISVYSTHYKSQVNDVACFYIDKADIPSGGTKFATYQGYEFYKFSDGNVRCYEVKTGFPVIDDFKCDGTYTYYFQADGTAMKDRLTYHPDGVHIIYFDGEGHEVFSDFANVKKSIAGDPVDDLCFFNVYGYMYVDVLTYDKAGVNLYYANPYGVMECNGWFQFSEEWGGGIGYANADGTLMCNTYTYDQNGNYVYIEGNGTVRGTSDLVARFSGTGSSIISDLTIPNGSYKVIVKYKGDDRYCSVKFYEADGSYGDLLGNGTDAEWKETTISTEDFYGGSIEVKCNGDGGEWSILFYRN